MGKDIVKRYEIVSKDGAIADPATQCDIEFLFTNLSSKAWKTNKALIQRNASIFAYTSDKNTARAAFCITPSNARKVDDIYCRVHNWKSVEIFIPQCGTFSAGECNKWLRCWILSHSTKNKAEYCQIHNWDPQLYTGITNWVDYVYQPHNWIEIRLNLPCKAVRFRPNTNQPKKYLEQYIAAVHESGCDKCPLFNIGCFSARSLGADEYTAKDTWHFWQEFKKNPKEAIQMLANRLKITKQ